MESCGTIIEQLLKNGDIAQVLKEGSKASTEIKALKQMLYQLGFDDVADPVTKEINGEYDEATTKTIQTFNEKNNIPANGEQVSSAVANMLIKRHNSLPDMLQLHYDLQNNNIASKYYKGSTDKQAIAALQNLLHDLGFKNELEWDKFKNNGEFGPATVNAVKAFLDKKKETLKNKIPELKDKHGFLNSCGNIIKHLIGKGSLGNILNEGPEDIALKEVKKSLHQLGFSKELSKAFDQLDGKLGPGIIDAVKSFGDKNGIPTDGKKITKKLGEALYDRIQKLPALHQLQRDLQEGKIGKYVKGSTSKAAVSALQTILTDLGHGSILQSSKNRHNGIFDNKVVNALKAHFKKGIFSKVDSVSSEMMHKIITDAGKKYGENWKDHVKYSTQNSNSVLTRYTASNYTGTAFIVNVAFIPSLEKINNYAIKNNVKIQINDAYRRGTYVPGAIVKPASRSNHKVGHAIDMNIIYDGGKVALSTYMMYTNRDNWAPPVKGFIEDIINDKILRWGGKFKHPAPDPVHIDDDLNHKDPEEWDKQRALTIKAFDEGDISDYTP